MSVPELVAGQIVGGKFTIRRERARTGLTATYEAITAPSRGVELKMLDPALRQQPDLDERMQRTMRASNDLPSSLVLQALDVGIDNDTSAPFVATELSMTPSLAELVQLCPLGVDEVLCFACNLATALDAAHARGLTHLALSPDNVFVGPAPRFEVRLADFGAYLLLGAPGSDPRWSAPELAVAPQIACDVFSAGLLTLFAASGAALEDRSEATLRAPATSLARATGSAIDARLDAPLARALALDPAQRYATVPELAAALATAFGKPAPVPAPSSRARLAAAPVASALAPLAAPPAPPPAPEEPAIAVAAAPYGEMSFDGSQPGPTFAAPAPSFEVAPSTPAPPSTKRSRTTLIVAVAAGIAGALGAIALIGVVLSRRADSRGTASTTTSSTTTSSTTTSSTTTSSASAPVVALAASAPANESPPVVPSPSSPPRTAAPPSATAGAARLTVICTPECDSITVDGEAVATFPAGIAPGNHTVTVHRGAHPPQTKQVTLTTDKEETVSFIFFATRPPPKKACGKFLQRCD